MYEYTMKLTLADKKQRIISIIAENEKEAIKLANVTLRSGGCICVSGTTMLTAKRTVYWKTLTLRSGRVYMYVRYVYFRG